MDAEILKALADPNRLQIVTLLARGERCVCDVSAALGISDALASHHLKRLKDAGLVNTRRKGLWLHCSLDPAALGTLAEELRALASAAASASAAACCALPKEGAPDE